MRYLFFFFFLVFHSNVYSSVSSVLSKHANPLDIVIESIASTPSQFGSVIAYPLTHYETVGWASLGAVSLIAMDKYTTQFVQDSINPMLDFKVPELNIFPTYNGTDEYLLLALCGGYLSGVIFEDPRLQRTALTSAKAILFSMGYSHMLLKFSFGRLRPQSPLASGNSLDYTTDPWDFGHRRDIQYASFVKGSAFPSFHFTMFSAVGRVVSNEYDEWLGYAVFLLGVLPDFRGHNHWVSDMVIGSLIGIMIGDAVTGRLDGPNNIPLMELGNNNFFLEPIVHENYFGGAFRVVFLE